MGSDANRLRRKWQDYSGRNALGAENNFYDVFNAIFQNTEYRIRKQPNEFKNSYLGYQLSSNVLDEIYNPPEGMIKQHGFSPDFAIDNTETNKTMYIESKRQDGWVEGGERRDGRGNAHERSCKFFTPGLLKTLREKGNIRKDALPFWTVFQGNITRDPCRVREITSWYEGYPGHFFFWRDSTNSEVLVNHFIKYIKPLLD